MKWQWVRVARLLPDMAEDFGDFCHSEVVLATDGMTRLTAYAVSWLNYEHPTQWKLTGPDAYDFDNVTHWQPLPELPS